MNKLDCANCKHWLHGYLDNELDTTTATHVAQHLAGCPDCKHRYEEIKLLAEGVRAHSTYFEAPPLLAQNIFANLPTQNAFAESTWQNAWNKVSNWFAPAFSLAALALAVMLYVDIPENQNPWLDEAVSGHVRSLMAEHLNDVISSDRHTVKPWFIGKIDFAPPVYDFTAQGYPLLGGRLDYLEHQTAAVLTYRRNKHIINTFILPTDETDSAPQNATDRGYNIVYWRQNHMRFILVSDLNKDELSALGQLMQKGG